MLCVCVSQMCKHADMQDPFFFWVGVEGGVDEPAICLLDFHIAQVLPHFFDHFSQAHLSSEGFPLLGAPSSAGTGRDCLFETLRVW